MNTDMALARLQSLCSRSEKCVADVQKKLHDWNVSATDALSIITTLQKQGFVDETRYAKAFVHDKSNLSHWGVLKIKHALQAKKIDASIITEALKKIDANHYKQELLELLNQKKITIKGSPTERKVKLLCFALSKGYEYQLIYDMLGQMKSES